MKMANQRGTRSPRTGQEDLSLHIRFVHIYIRLPPSTVDRVRELGVSLLALAAVLHQLLALLLVALAHRGRDALAVRLKVILQRVQVLDEDARNKAITDAVSLARDAEPKSGVDARVQGLELLVALRCEGLGESFRLRLASLGAFRLRALCTSTSALLLLDPSLAFQRLLLSAPSLPGCLLAVAERAVAEELLLGLGVNLGARAVRQESCEAVLVIGEDVQVFELPHRVVGDVLLVVGLGLDTGVLLRPQPRVVHDVVGMLGELGVEPLAALLCVPEAWRLGSVQRVRRPNARLAAKLRRLALRVETLDHKRFHVVFVLALAAELALDHLVGLRHRQAAEREWQLGECGKKCGSARNG